MRPIPGTITDPAMTRLIFGVTPESTELNDLLVLAESIARVSHHGQQRRGNGEPYFEHVRRVAGSVPSTRGKIVAYLHDTIEDTGVTASGLRQLFPDHIVQDVEMLTRIPGESYRSFITNLADSGTDTAIEVKLADITDNLTSLGQLPYHEGEGLRRRYDRALIELRAELDARELIEQINQAAA